MGIFRYVEGLMARVGSPDALKPPLPPLTRYKRDVALKLQNMPSNGSMRPATLPHDKCCPSRLVFDLFVFMSFYIWHEPCRESLTRECMSDDCFPHAQVSWL